MRLDNRDPWSKIEQLLLQECGHEEWHGLGSLPQSCQASQQSCTHSPEDLGPRCHPAQGQLRDNARPRARRARATRLCPLNGRYASTTLMKTRCVRAWINKERYDHITGQASLLGYGSWQHPAKAMLSPLLMQRPRPMTPDLKAGSLPSVRPHSISGPMQERMAARLQDWGSLWQLRDDGAALPRPSPKLAQHHARELPELTVGHLKRVLKPLPDIASAPDAVSTQVFNSAPSIPKLIQQMEKEACLPSQLRLHMVVMLAKNSQIEGPIALTSILYRAWCRLLLMSGSAAHPARRLRGAGTPERRRSPRLRTNVASLS